MAEESDTISITKIAIFHIGKRLFKFNAEVLKARCPQLYELWKNAGYPAECVLNNVTESTFDMVHKAIVNPDYVWPHAMLADDIAQLTRFAQKMEMKWLMGYVNDIIQREYLISEDFENIKEYGNYVLENIHVGMFVKVPDRGDDKFTALVLKVVGERSGTVVQLYCIETQDILVEAPERIEIMTTIETAALRKKLMIKGDTKWVR